MHFALDLDGTISAAPELFRTLGKALVDNDHAVTVLTGALFGFPDSARTVEGRSRQLESLGLEKDTHYNDIQLCVAASGEGVAQMKADWCKENAVVFLIDDESVYCDAVAKVTHVAQFRRP